MVGVVLLAELGGLMDAVAALRERVEILEEQFRQFRETFAPMTQARSWNGLRLTRIEAVILEVLSDGCNWQTKWLLDRIESLCPSRHGRPTDALRVHISKLRAKLAALEPPVVLPWARDRAGNIYRLPQESLTLLAARRVA